MSDGVVDLLVVVGGSVGFSVVGRVDAFVVVEGVVEVVVTTVVVIVVVVTNDFVVVFVVVVSVVESVGGGATDVVVDSDKQFSFHDEQSEHGVSSSH